MTAQTSFNLSDIKQSYNGWADWTTWNVALWINNDECLHSIAKECKTYNEFLYEMQEMIGIMACLLYTSTSPRDYAASRMPSSA